MTTATVPRIPETDTLLTAEEVAVLYRVKRKTVWSWGRSGLITRVPTPGGHFRYSEAEVKALMRGDSR